MDSKPLLAIGRLFDIVGNSFDYYPQHFHRHLQAMTAFCSACCAPADIEGQVCLDAGCGSGTASLYFAAAGARQVVGIDLSRSSLEIARAASASGKRPSSLFAEGDLGNLPLGDRTFDFVFCCGALPYAEDPERCLAELVRVTNTPGRIVLLALKRSPLDPFYEALRRLLAGLPAEIKPVLARFIAVLARLPARFLLGRRVGGRQGKPLEQTVLEAFFSPVALKKLDYETIRDYFTGNGFTVSRVNGIRENDFYSEHTGCVVRAVRAG